MPVSASIQAEPSERDFHHSYRSPAQSLVILALALFLAELIAMFILQLLPPMAAWINAATDGAIMIVIASPALYRLVLQPMERHIREHRRVEGELRQSHEHLEEIVAVRTSELRAAKAELELQVQARTADLEATTESLEIERRRFSDLLELLPAYVVLLSPEYRVRFANRFFRERFGELQGRRSFEELFHPDALRESFRVFETQAPHRWNWVGPDGRNYDVQDFLFTDMDGSPLIMEVGLDITDRRRAEEALKHANDCLERRVTERTEELRTANDELTRFNDVVVGRELRMVELKIQINALCAELGRPPFYEVAFVEKP